MNNQKGFTNYLILIAAIFLVGFFGYRYYNSNLLTKFKKDTLPAVIKKAINNDKTLFSIGAIKESNGVYEFQLTINNQTYTSYITKDGKILFPNGVKMEPEQKKTTTQTTPAQTETKKLTCQDLTKSKTPNLTAYVVSDCPYGLQMQRVFKKAIGELPQLEGLLNVKYIGSIENNKITSMHGDKEAVENLKQICIREEQRDKYWTYVSCYMQEGNTDSCLSQTGVDTEKLTACTTDAKKGLKYAQADFDAANKLKISGSPTLILNGKQTVSEFDFGGRVANAIKDIVCCGSSAKADYCQNTLSKTEVSSSFSKTDAATVQGANDNANCN